MIKEEDGSSCDGSEHELRLRHHHHPASSSLLSSSSANCVSSSTNGNGHGVVASTSNPVLASPLRRTLDEAARKHLIGNALVAVGTQIMSAAAAAAQAQGPLNFGTLSLEATTSQLSSILERTTASTTTAGSGSNKSSGSDGSNSASPLSNLGVGDRGSGSVSGGGRTSSAGGSSSGRRKGPKPRAADSPASGSTTSTTTGQGTGRERQFVCAICDRSFGYKHVLQNHERTHTGEKPFECRVCNKRFTRDHHLKTHMRLHTGEKPYHCEHCDRHFVQVANLRRHMRVHTGERPYPCGMCDAKFSDSNQLKAHNLIHRNEKPFSCQRCNGKFRRRHHMNNHKCPRDDANVGRPRRGRKPRDPYDHDVLGLSPPPGLLAPVVAPGSVSPPSISTNGLLLPSSSLSSTVSSSTPLPFPYPANIQALLQMNQHHLPLLTTIRDESLHRSIPPPAHAHVAAALESSTKSRRKPKTTMRILTPEQKHRYMMDTQSIQTQPLNMAVKSARSSGYSRGTDGVLDLSSRSKSDVESDNETDRKDWDDYPDDDPLVDDLDEADEEDADPQDLSRRSSNNSNNGFHSSYHKEILRSS